MSENVVRIKVTVEPRGSRGVLSEVVEVDAAELEGLAADAREAHLARIAEDTANELAPWGWCELGDGES
jgi:hypothetical protein